MSSLTVQEIQGSASSSNTISVASGQTFKANTIAGTTTAGSILVTGEGNSTTTNLQQGLAKVWVHHNQVTSHSIYDSFNVSYLGTSWRWSFV